MIGEVIGSYEIVQQIGKGGMGVVYLGQHTLLGRRAAIKVLLPMHSSRPEIVNRFFNEARAVTSISDPGIVQVFDFGYHSDGGAFIVMELLEGDAMDRRLRKAGRFGVVEALRLARMICTSLGAAHAAGVVHRDLKPENIFIVRDPAVLGGERAKVLDFGIAKLAADDGGVHRTRTGALMGTPMYMSPEQCRGAGEVDHRSDIYAMGCVMYTMLTGRPPFDGDGTGALIVAHLQQPPPRASARVAGLPAAIDEIVLRCLAKTPDERFGSMAELVWALDAAEVALAQDAPAPRPSGAVPALVRPRAMSEGMPAPAGLATTPPMLAGMPTPPPLPAVPAMVTGALPITPAMLGGMPTTLSTAFGETAPPPRGRGRLVVVIGAMVVGGAIAVGALAGRTARSHAPDAPGKLEAAPARIEPAAPPAVTVDRTASPSGGPDGRGQALIVDAGVAPIAIDAAAAPASAPPHTPAAPPAPRPAVDHSPAHPPAPPKGDHAKPPAPPPVFDRSD